MFNLILAAYLAVVPPRVITLHQCSDSPNAPYLIQSLRSKTKTVNVYGVRCTDA